MSIGPINRSIVFSPVARYVQLSPYQHQRNTTNNYTWIEFNVHLYFASQEKQIKIIEIIFAQIRPGV